MISPFFSENTMSPRSSIAHTCLLGGSISIFILQAHGIIGAGDTLTSSKIAVCRKIEGPTWRKGHQYTNLKTAGSNIDANGESLTGRFLVIPQTSFRPHQARIRTWGTCVAARSQHGPPSNHHVDNVAGQKIMKIVGKKVVQLGISPGANWPTRSRRLSRDRPHWRNWNIPVQKLRCIRRSKACKQGFSSDKRTLTYSLQRGSLTVSGPTPYYIILY